MKMMLLAGAAALALTAGGAYAAHNTLPPVVKTAHTGKAFHFMPHNGSTVLYDQSASSGWSSWAIGSVVLESSAYAIYDSQAADDFVLPTGKHKITAVYAPGQNAYGSGYTAANFDVTFYTKIKATDQGTKVKVLKTCPSSPASDLNGDGIVLIDVSSCKVKAKGGSHDYSVSVQAITPSGLGEENWWYWQENQKQIRTMAWWQNYGGGFNQCSLGYFEPLWTCFPCTGIGPDLAFAIIGN
jgi:hypothetical protein